MKIGAAHWRVPSEARAFDGWLEGAPTPAQRERILAEVRAERARWAPGPAAYQQLRELCTFIGRRVTVQFWDPIMTMLDDEGPYPLRADCRNVVTSAEEGFEQAYLLLDKVVEQPNACGYSPKGYLKRCPQTGLQKAPVAELFEIDTLTT